MFPNFPWFGRSDAYYIIRALDDYKQVSNARMAAIERKQEKFDEAVTKVQKSNSNLEAKNWEIKAIFLMFVAVVMIVGMILGVVARNVFANNHLVAKFLELVE